MIVTVRNDREGLAELVSALADQTDMPDEVVVVDGGSRDGTLLELQGWDADQAPLRVVEAPGANIAAGRKAIHDWIVSTDAGCRPEPGWLAAFRAVRPDADIAAGVYIVEAKTSFEQAVAYSHYPAIEELDLDSRFIRLSHRLFGRDFRAYQAGGRSMAFSRAAWQAVGGFPQGVYAGEDLAFSAAAVKRGFRAVLVEEAVVRWRPRETWVETAQMFRTYARGDIRTKGRGRHVARWAAWLGGPMFLRRGTSGMRLLALAAALGYMALPLHRAHRSRLRKREWWRIPTLIVLKDLSQLVGSSEGLVDELRGVPQPNPQPPPP